MSGLHSRSSRSRSKPAETGAQTTTTTDTGHSTPTHIPAPPTPEPLESLESASPALARDEPHPRNNAAAKDTPTGNTAVEPSVTMSTEANGSAPPDTALNGGVVDPGDEGSSSLSEPEESIEDRDEAALRDHASPDAEENDSEAETERIDSTPRKLTRTATDVTNGSEGPAGRSPSKLAKVMTAEQDNANASPALPTRQRKAGSEAADHSDEDDTVLPDARHDVEDEADDSHAADGSDRKRKRSSSALSSIADDLDNEQPARKRHGSSKPFEPNGDPMEVEGEVEHAAEDEDDHASKETEAPAEEDENEEAAHEAANEAPAGLRRGKGKKGARKGKKAKAAEHEEPAATPLEVEDEEAAEGELDGEDAGVIEEERGRKHNALEELNKIEKQFLTFQKRRLEEQLERLSLELEQLKQPNSTHHEYLLMLQAVDKRRDEKIRQEDVRLGLKRDILRKQFVAMRNSVHGQYMHDVAEVRMDYLTQCNHRVTQLQRERRYWGTNDADYTLKFNQKRSQQVHQQTAYNLEVSVLSGIAKHVGFPAAPDLSSARAPEMDQDLAAMGIQSRPAQPHVRPPGAAESSRADRAAEEQFFEQNAWANPQHPAHNHSHYNPMNGPQPRPASNPFATPAAQRDRIDLQAPNGSASTIDMQSNPPSGTAAHGHNSAPQRDAYESPVLQLKQAMARNQDSHPPADTPVRPSSHPPRETSQPDSHRPRDIYDNPSLMTHLAPGSAAEGPAPGLIKDEDAGEQLQRAALPRTGLVGGGLFR